MFFELNYIFLFSNSFISNLSMYWAMLKVMRIVHKGVMHEDNIIWQCKSLIKFSGDYNYVKLRVFHTIFHICIVFEFKVCDHILGFWFLKLNIFYFELFMKFMLVDLLLSFPFGVNVCISSGYAHAIICSFIFSVIGVDLLLLTMNSIPSECLYQFWILL